VWINLGGQGDSKSVKSRTGNKRESGSPTTHCARRAGSGTEPSGRRALIKPPHPFSQKPRYLFWWRGFSNKHNSPLGPQNHPTTFEPELLHQPNDFCIKIDFCSKAHCFTVSLFPLFHCFTVYCFLDRSFCRFGGLNWLRFGQRLTTSAAGIEV
jgi:hypothetical protein